MNNKKINNNKKLLWGIGGGIVALLLLLFFISIAANQNNNSSGQSTSSVQASISTESSTEVFSSSPAASLPENSSASEAASTTTVPKENASKENASKNEPSNSNNQNSEPEKEPEDTSSEKDWVADLNVAKRTDQLIMVAASGTSATVSIHIKDSSGEWKEVFSTSGYVGKDGVGQASEYVSRSPQGVWGFCAALGKKADPGSSLSYIQVDDSYHWVDDPDSKYYNKLVSTNDVEKDWNSSEHISEYGSVYNYILALDYNSECIPGKGSAFFLHCSNGKATGGCIAIPESYMVQVMRLVNSNCLIVIDSKSGIMNY